MAEEQQRQHGYESDRKDDRKERVSRQLTSDQQSATTATEIALIHKDISSMNEKLDAIMRELPNISKRIDVVERAEGIYHTELNDVPSRVRDLERWKDKADGALGLTKWALAGGVVGVISMIVTIVALVLKVK